MRFGYDNNHSYQNQCFDRVQILGWQDQAATLLNTPLEQLDEAAQLHLAAQLKSHMLSLFRDEGSTFYVFGTTPVYPVASQPLPIMRVKL